VGREKAFAVGSRNDEYGNWNKKGAEFSTLAFIAINE
jgi:hypothetical protein